MSCSMLCTFSMLDKFDVVEKSAKSSKRSRERNLQPIENYWKLLMTRPCGKQHCQQASKLLHRGVLNGVDMNVNPLWAEISPWRPARVLVMTRRVGRGWHNGTVLRISLGIFLFLRCRLMIRRKGARSFDIFGYLWRSI
jgi:hypothetical protein